MELRTVLVVSSTSELPPRPTVVVLHAYNPT